MTTRNLATAAAVILTETIRGGVGRGLRAQAGANLTFVVLIVSLALGLSVVTPSGIAHK